MGKKERVSSVAAGAGFAADVWGKLDRAVRELGGTDEDIYRIGTPEGDVLIDEMAKLLVIRQPASSTAHFTPLPDSQVPSIHQPTILKYRAEAARQGVLDSTPLCYRVATGFTLKTHAPQAGPCCENFQYLQSWNFPDEPTSGCLVFWIPRLVSDSINKTVNEQKTLLAEFRQRLDLPAHHCSNFGSVALLSGLILAHHKATGEKVPLNGLWTRTDTCLSGGSRLSLDWLSGALCCGYGAWDDARDVLIGCSALGVETLGS